MSEFIRRAAPGVALAGVALSTVWLLDPGLHADATRTASATDDVQSDSGATDSGSGSGSGATDSGAGTASSDCSTTDTATGEAVMTRWGPVQVQMEFAPDGSVCSVQAIAYPDNDSKSSRINARAVPYLDQQATEVGTSFDSVSGATYTSEAYRASMQSILDQR